MTTEDNGRHRPTDYDEAPEWVKLLVEELDDGLTFIRCFELQGLVHLAERMLDWSRPDVEAFLRREAAPRWMSSLALDYSLAPDRWAQAAIRAHLQEAVDLLAEVADLPEDQNGAHAL